jgi:uncharacterized protein involved in exopolysaccharide biosynthesis
MKALWREKVRISLYGSVLPVCIFAYLLFQPNVYRSEALLVASTPQNSSIGNSAVLNQLGTLAGVRGLGQSDGSSDKIRAIATLQSRQFVQSFVSKHDIAVPFMAAKPGPQQGTIVIDPAKYDLENAKWVSNSWEEGEFGPTDWEIYGEFSEIFSVSENIDTGLVTIAIEWYDPELIKQWLSWMIDDLNENAMSRELEEAKKSIDFLEKEIGETQLIEMRNVFYNLIESQTQTLVLAQVREEYAFQIIDPPVVAREPIAPQRLAVFLISLILSFSAATIFVFYRLPVLLVSRASQ